MLLGDAAHTAHFSIGSGTKLAMEDAVALAWAFRTLGDDVSAALAAYEAERRPIVESTQRAAQASLEWFEGIVALRRAGADPVRVQPADPQPARDLRQPAAARSEGSSARSTRFADGTADRPPMFTPLRLRGLTLPNRVVVSPMDMYSAVDGTPGDFHLVHLGSRALGGAGARL